MIAQVPFTVEALCQRQTQCRRWPTCCQSMDERELLHCFVDVDVGAPYPRDLGHQNQPLGPNALRGQDSAEQNMLRVVRGGIRCGGVINTTQ